MCVDAYSLCDPLPRCVNILLTLVVTAEGPVPVCAGPAHCEKRLSARASHATAKQTSPWARACVCLACD